MKLDLSLLICTLTISFTVFNGTADVSVAQEQQQLPVLPSPSPAPLPASSVLPSSEGAPLKPGDRLRLTVIGFPEVSGEQTVMSDGGLQIPFAGYLNVWGFTPSQVTEIVTTKLTPYIRRPQVSLAIDSLSPARVSVTGSVARSGPLVLGTPTNSSQRANTLSEALSLAGGVTPNADVSNILIRRHIYANRNLANGDIPVQNVGPSDRITVDLLQSIQDGDLTADIPVYDGDEIIVPASAELTGIEQQDLLSSSIAPDEIVINVGGEVNRPGAVEVSPSANVSSAVAAAGGLTQDGAAKNIILLRISGDSTVENYVYDLGEDSIPLRHGDSIIVSRSTRSQVSSFFQIIGNALLPFRFFRD
jgi:polysaccharide export outer membrane protein